MHKPLTTGRSLKRNIIFTVTTITPRTIFNYFYSQRTPKKLVTFKTFAMPTYRNDTWICVLILDWEKNRHADAGTFARSDIAPTTQVC